jgi:hypothetical protein
MATRNCRDCQNPVSSSAAKCPKCGCSYPGNSAATQAMCVIMAIPIAIGMVMWIFNWLGAH